MALQASPFIFDGPVPPGDLIGRGDELAALVDRAHQGRFTLLHAPRRFGKTSIIHRLAADAAVTGDLAVITVDLQGVQTLGDVARRIETAYRGVPRTPLAKVITTSLAGMARLGLQVGAAGVRVAPTAETAAPTLERLLELPFEAGAKAAIRVLVVFDEFQAIADVAGADAVLRSRIQHQREHVSYLFSGSEQHLLASIFADRARPLFGQAEQVELGPLPSGPAADFVAERFAATDRDPGVALEELIQLAGGHPQRLAFLADSLWHSTSPGETSDARTWDEAVGRALRRAAAEFTAVDAGLTSVQRRLLRVLAYGERPYGAAAARVGLHKGSAADAIPVLVERGVLRAADDVSIVDPLLALWSRDHYDAP
ncbi:MAG: hypothetical protein JWM05_1621 [Acidimicrobiales bacterium]|nr:hypothetical protein [Acidimicrobiales bacterium]